MTIQQIHGRETGQPPTLDASLLSEVMTPAIKAATSIQRGMMERAAAYQHEWLGFVATRCQENMTMPVRLAGCRSLPEMQQVYADYWKRTVDHYGSEFKHLGEIARTSQNTNPSPPASASRTQERSTPPSRGDTSVRTTLNG